MRRVKRATNVCAQAVIEAVSVRGAEDNNKVGVGPTTMRAGDREAGGAGLPSDPAYPMSRSHTTWRPALFLALLAVATQAKADLINTGFQTQDYSGWTWTHDGIIGGQIPSEPTTRETSPGQYGLRLLPGAGGIIPGGPGTWTSTISQSSTLPLTPPGDQWSFYLDLYTGMAGVPLAQSRQWTPVFTALVWGYIEGSAVPVVREGFAMRVWVGAASSTDPSRRYLIWLPEGWSIQQLSGWDHWVITTDDLSTHFSSTEQVTVSFTNWIWNGGGSSFLHSLATVDDTPPAWASPVGLADNVTVVPIPGAAILGVLGLGVSAWMKRRY